jgi:hypothetical protein
VKPRRSERILKTRARRVARAADGAWTWILQWLFAAPAKELAPRRHGEQEIYLAPF